VVVFFTSFLGVPHEYKEWILIVAGILLMGIGYLLRRNAFLKSIEDAASGERRADAFVESGIITHTITPAQKDDTVS
jgi:hypothetical protein